MPVKGEWAASPKPGVETTIIEALMGSYTSEWMVLHAYGNSKKTNKPNPAVSKDSRRTRPRRTNLEEVLSTQLVHRSLKPLVRLL